jgi:DNA polymerase
LKHSIWLAGDSIPWEWGGVKQNKTPLSLDKAREQCRKDGIPAPTTFREDSEESTEWEEKYSAQYPWITAIRHWRKANRLLRLLTSLQTRTRPDGTFPYLIKYFGAHTGRFSGGDGVNMQNLPKYPFDQSAILEGEDESFLREIEVRPMFVSAPGKQLVIADLSQIEARVLLHLAGDKRQLEAIRNGFNVYEAHARTTMGWEGGPLKAERPDLYALAKARCLGLGYGCGRAKFQLVAKLMANVILTSEEAANTVDAYRESNPLICQFWGTLNSGLRAAAVRNEPFKLMLPSGRSLEYFKAHFEGRDLKAQVERGGTFYKFWGGVLVENVTQAVARDVFVNSLLLAEEKGVADLAFHVHDEGIWMADSEGANEALHEVEQCLSQPPPWAEDLPLGAEGVVSPFYRKPD